MCILQENPDLTHLVLAYKLGFIAGVFNCCICPLIVKSLVKKRNFQNNRNNFKQLFLFLIMYIVEKFAQTFQLQGWKLAGFERLKLETEALELETESERFIGKSWVTK